MPYLLLIFLFFALDVTSAEYNKQYVEIMATSNDAIFIPDGSFLPLKNLSGYILKDAEGRCAQIVKLDANQYWLCYNSANPMMLFSRSISVFSSSTNSKILYDFAHNMAWLQRATRNNNQ